jgi:hypothetical protein
LYHLLDSQGERMMEENRGASGAAEIGMLRQQILALADADCVRPEDEGALLVALDAALRELGVGDMPAARAGIERFIAGAQRLIEAGVLAGREGNAALEVARCILSRWSG